MKSALRPPALLPGRARLSVRRRPRKESAGLPVRLDVLGVELGGIVVGRGESLLHHHRRQTTLLVAGLMAHVPDGMTDLMVDHILPVRADVPFERHGSADPARLVDE